jgi:5-methylcytosine-specific restriction endonuclease McrA
MAVMPTRPPQFKPPGARSKAEADKARPSAQARGYDSKWQRAAKAFLAEPGNRYCACGCGLVAEVVDHIRPHKGDRKLFWNRANWQPMTSSCHNRKTALADGRWG